MQDQPVEYDSGAGCLTRLYWMFLGNALLFFLFGILLQKHPRFPSFWDAGCLLTLASLVYVRYIDIAFFKGQTCDCNVSATLADWRKYSVFLVLGSVVAWLVVRFV